MYVIITSGGQAGVDRGALLAALNTGVAYTGWVPKGGRCEDSAPILFMFPCLHETTTGDYRVRTELNVRDTDVTLIVTMDGRISSPGSRLTQQLCEQYRRPYRVCTIRQGEALLVQLFMNWRQPVLRVNIAGVRESRCPGIQEQTRWMLIHAIQQARQRGLLTALPVFDLDKLTDQPQHESTTSKPQGSEERKTISDREIPQSGLFE